MSRYEEGRTGVNIPGLRPPFFRSPPSFSLPHPLRSECIDINTIPHYFSRPQQPRSAPAGHPVLHRQGGRVDPAVAPPQLRLLRARPLPQGQGRRGGPAGHERRPPGGQDSPRGAGGHPGHCPVGLRPAALVPRLAQVRRNRRGEEGTGGERKWGQQRHPAVSSPLTQPSPQLSGGGRSRASCLSADSSLLFPCLVLYVCSFFLVHCHCMSRGGVGWTHRSPK